MARNEISASNSRLMRTSGRLSTPHAYPVLFSQLRHSRGKPSCRPPHEARLGPEWSRSCSPKRSDGDCGTTAGAPVGPPDGSHGFARSSALLFALWLALELQESHILLSFAKRVLRRRMAHRRGQREERNVVRGIQGRVEDSWISGYPLILRCGCFRRWRMEKLATSALAALALEARHPPRFSHPGCWE